jgi:two-component system OmpR family sensor kinase
MTERHLVEQVDERLGQADQQDLDLLPRRGNHGLSEFFAGVIVDGTLTVTAEPELAGANASPPDVDPERVSSADDRELDTLPAEDGSIRYRVRYADYRTTDGEPVIAFFALPLEDVDDAVARLRTVAFVSTGAALAVVALVAWWVVHLGVRPIKRMTETATAIAGGELSHRVPDATPGTEAGELGTALNSMLGRIEEAFDERTRSEDRLRRFIADASHELRTPITTVRGYAELYRAGGLPHGEDLDEAMRRTEQESVRMGGLIEDMLQLARLDQGRPLLREAVDLAEVAADAARDAGAVAPDRSVTCEAVGPIVVSADEDRIRQVVANVVGNALVHTDPGTPIVVRAFRTGDHARLEVVDRGAGMPPEVAEHAFERFFRADPSRSRHRGGSGLGLSIVQSVVAAHGGQASIESQVGLGTTVRIDLPLAEVPGTSSAAPSFP